MQLNTKKKYKVLVELVNYQADRTSVAEGSKSFALIRTTFFAKLKIYWSLINF